MPRKSIHIFCVDEDQNFCQTIAREAEVLGVKTTFTASIDEKNHKISSFSAYILDVSNLKHRSLFKDGCVSLAFQTLPPPSELEKLKNQYAVDFVAGKPMGAEEARYLITKVCQLPNVRETSCDWVNEIPDDLMQQYLRLTYQRLEIVSDIIKKIQIHACMQVWQELEKIVHKIAGSAGMYGRALASEMCKKIEEEIKNKNYLDLDLQTFYRQLYLYVQ